MIEQINQFKIKWLKSDLKTKARLRKDWFSLNYPQDKLERYWEAVVNPEFENIYKKNRS